MGNCSIILYYSMKKDVGFGIMIKKEIKYIRHFWKSIYYFILTHGEEKRGRNGYWYRWIPFSKKKYMVFRMSRPTGIGALIPMLLQCFEYADDMGFIPIVDYEYSRDLMNGYEPRERNNCWDCIFEQKSLDDIEANASVYVGGLDVKYVSEKVRNRIFIEPLDTHLRDVEETSDWRGYFANVNYYYEKWFRIKNDLYNQMQREWASLVDSHDKVLGIMLREEFSIDRELLATDDPLRMHPLLPKVNELAEQIQYIMNNNHCTKLYVGTCFEESISVFQDLLGRDKVIFCERRRDKFDTYIKLRQELSQMGIGKNPDIEEEFSKINRNYVGVDIEDMLGYFRDIYYISMCNAFVGVKCSGARTALIINGGKYEIYEYCKELKN